MTLSFFFGWLNSYPVSSFFLGILAGIAHGPLMGIKFRCHGCDKKLHVKAFLAGKRGVCPHCGARVRIPLADEVDEGAPGASEHRRRSGHQGGGRRGKAAGVRKVSARTVVDAADSPREKGSFAPSSAAADEPDPIAEAPEAVWYVRPPTGGQYGPADGDIMRRWLDEGRVSPDSLVWREGWDDWKTGDAAFPSLRRVLPQSDVPAVSTEEAPPEVRQEPLVLGDNGLAGESVRKRLASRSNTRGVAIVVTLAILCAALLIALWLVVR